MFFVKFQCCVNLYFRMSQKNFVIIMICFRCVRNKKNAKCIRINKKYEFTMFKINFFDIDQIKTKLEKKN